MYIGRDNNAHDKRFVEILSEAFEVREIYTQNTQPISSQGEVFSNIVLVVAGPLTDGVSAIPLEVKFPIFGISHAFDLNIEYGDFPILANIKRCTAIMSDCRYISNILREIYDFKGNIYEIPWGCDFDFFSRADIQFGTKPNILVTRNWFTLYRNDVIISALESLELKELEFNCTFIGDGNLLEKQIQDLKQVSVKNKLRFLGHQNRLEIRNTMATSWLYISAASSDGTSISLLEAMAAGMICITTDFPSNREWIEHSINGFTFPNGDSKALASLIELISSLSLEEKLEISRTAKDTVQNRGNWRNNQKTFISSVMRHVQII